jgi:hypothetical protein
LVEELKDPFESDNWSLKLLFALNVPVSEY